MHKITRDQILHTDVDTEKSAKKGSGSKKSAKPSFQKSMINQEPENLAPKDITAIQDETDAEFYRRVKFETVRDFVRKIEPNEISKKEDQILTRRDVALEYPYYGQDFIFRKMKTTKNMYYWLQDQKKPMSNPDHFLWWIKKLWSLRLDL